MAIFPSSQITDPDVRAVIQKFEALQLKLSDFGAYDSEAWAVFHWAIAQEFRITNRPLPDPSSWQLFRQKGSKKAAESLTVAAQRSGNAAQGVLPKRVV
jgi:hypothetical protein